MKLNCPRCQASVKIGDESRFDFLRCGACQHVFMGLEAEIGMIDFLLGFFFGLETSLPALRNAHHAPGRPSPWWLCRAKSVLPMRA